ncbi:hypothetical protein BG261_01580 [Floricoccus tropicus]|uniref:Aldehyde dehydrogenase domain-containing protein n=1 Tax=Floricoccus tropicus TaxID=1859473 RepID=A0A1E8GP63_9LACT|nr:hypothetical protein BG261_01580 [Floricoccus tropicus]
MLETIQKTELSEVIDSLVINANEALNVMNHFDQTQVDKIVDRMAEVAMQNVEKLAKMAHEETGRGVYEHKVIKNTFAAENVYNDIKNEDTVGIINEDTEKGLLYVAEPVGVICGVVPTTNPTSTTIFKSLIALKTRNPIIFAFHPAAQKSSSETARLMRDAAIEAGAPENCIQWLPEPSIEATALLMNNPGVAIVLATGGAAMVRAAYSTGKPALGVGPGNVPAYVEKSANIKRSVEDIFNSKIFDNGMICAAEQVLIVDEDIYDEVKSELEARDTYFVRDGDISRLEDVVLNEEKTMVNGAIVGLPATVIAKMAGITDVPETAKMLIAEIDDVGVDYPLSREKLSPVLAMVKSSDSQDGIDKVERMLNVAGLGHTACIHTEDKELQKEFGRRIKACRILVNSPSSQGAIGDLFNNLTPSLTLGCGSYGRNSLSHNTTAMDLLNIKRIALRKEDL